VLQESPASKDLKKEKDEKKEEEKKEVKKEEKEKKEKKKGGSVTLAGMTPQAKLERSRAQGSIRSKEWRLRKKRALEKDKKHKQEEEEEAEVFFLSH